MSNGYKKVATYEATKEECDHVLLLYSGGLDTSVMLKWIQDEFECEVTTLTINIGQDECFDGIKEKALALGAKEAIVIDAREEFAEECLKKAIKANGQYQEEYHLFCPLGRVMISDVAVRVAQEKGIKVIGHGCTGKGNDQVRFDSYIITLDSSLKVIAPVREWGLGREEEIAYAKEHNIPIPRTVDKPYAHDDNLWGRSSEGAEIEHIHETPDLENFLKMCVPPEKGPDKPEMVKISFKKGVPTALNGKKLPLVELIPEVNKIGGKHGVGISYVVEDRIIGIKARNVFEEPGAAILIAAHKALERIVCTKEETTFKPGIDKEWGELCFSAKWHNPLMDDLNAFIDKMNERVTGDVTVKVYKGHIAVTALDSPFSLVDENLATFMKSDSLNQNASAGFIEMYNLSQQTYYKMQDKD